MRLRSTTLALALLALSASPALAVVSAGGLNNSDGTPPPKSRSARPAAPQGFGQPGAAPAADEQPAPPPPPPGAAAPAPAPIAAPSGPPVATVNGVAILKSEYDRTFEMIKRRYAARYGIDFASDRGKAMEAEIKSGLMSHLVEKQFVLNEGIKRNLKVTPEQVEAKVAELKKQSGTEAEFNSNLTANGMTIDDLRKEVADGLLVRQVADALTANIQVADKDAKAYYDSHATEFDKPEEVRVRHILVKDKATAEKLLGMLKGGADFEMLAKSNSEDPGSKEDGGDLGFFGKGRMVPEFEEAAFKLKPGELSPIVQTQFGFHILQGVDRHAARHVPYDEAKPQITEQLAEGRKESALSKWLEQQRKTAKITYAPGYAPPKPAENAPAPKPSAKPAKPKGK